MVEMRNHAVATAKVRLEREVATRLLPITPAHFATKPSCDRLRPILFNLDSSGITCGLCNPPIPRSVSSARDFHIVVDTHRMPPMFILRALMELRAAGNTI